MSQILHTKFRINRSAGSRKKRILKGFTIYTYGGHHGDVTSIMLMNLHFLVPYSLHRKLNLVKWPSGF